MGHGLKRSAIRLACDPGTVFCRLIPPVGRKGDFKNIFPKRRSSLDSCRDAPLYSRAVEERGGEAVLAWERLEASDERPPNRRIGYGEEGEQGEEEGPEEEGRKEEEVAPRQPPGLPFVRLARHVVS